MCHVGQLILRFFAKLILLAFMLKYVTVHNVDTAFHHLEIFFEVKVMPEKLLEDFFCHLSYFKKTIFPEVVSSCIWYHQSLQCSCSKN